MYGFSKDRNIRRRQLYRQQKACYSDSRLKQYVMEASQMRDKSEFDLPTRYYNKFEETLQSILTHDRFDGEMSFSTGELKFIIYLLMAHIEETNALYEDIDKVFQRLSKRQNIEEID